jgi:hypothetical protein
MVEMKHLRTAILLCLLALASSACASEVGGGVGTLELGTGEWMFEPFVVEEQEVPLIAGVQGGYHVWLSAHTTGVGDRVLFDIATQPLDESRPEEGGEVYVFMDEMGDDAWEILGYPAVLSTPACDLGKPLRVRVTLTDEEGDTATDECIVVPTGDRETLGLPPCD